MKTYWDIHSELGVAACDGTHFTMYYWSLKNTFSVITTATWLTR